MGSGDEFDVSCQIGKGLDPGGRRSGLIIIERDRDGRIVKLNAVAMNDIAHEVDCLPAAFKPHRNVAGV